jgi:hypothetical protein
MGLWRAVWDDERRRSGREFGARGTGGGWRLGLTVEGRDAYAYGTLAFGLSLMERRGGRQS